MATNVNLLALVVVPQHYPDYYTQVPKPYKTHAQSTRQTPSTRYHTTTRNKGKEIVKPLSPPSKDESDKEQAQRDKNKNMDTSPRTWNDRKTRQFGNVGNQVVQKSRIQCYKCKGFGHFSKECKKPKRAKDYEYCKKKMMLCKQESKDIPLSEEQSE
ncbi:integrase, catalytic region, zinc finger, CCHC-type containing protein [Tanacetum coccineum]